MNSPKPQTSADVNTVRTAQVQADPVFQEYLEWLRQHGCVFPRVELPVAFWEEGVLGVRAAAEIPPGTAVVCVPYRLTLNLPRALESEIGWLFEHYPVWFRGHSQAYDYIFWTFLLYERLKGSNSFWQPYFRTLPRIQLLTDWSKSDLAELQDSVLVSDCEKTRRQLNRIWDSLSEVYLENSKYFPGCTEYIRHQFEWVWRVSTSRSFAWESGMLIPLADAFNHGPHQLDHQKWTAQEIAAANPPRENQTATSPTCWNRLEKLLVTGKNAAALASLEAAWEVDVFLTEFESDDDAENLRCYGDCDSDPESVGSRDKPKLSQWRDVEASYFVLITQEDTSFHEGEQVFMSYGQLSNRELLLDYGFALEDNPYDAYYFRLWKPSCGQSGLVTPQQIIDPTRRQASPYATLDSLSILVTLKRKTLNTEVFKYFRAFVSEVPEDIERPGITCFPVNVAFELVVIDTILDLYYQLQSYFPTSAEHDEALLCTDVGVPRRYAVVYRLSQKRILQTQIAYVEELQRILLEVQSGMSLETHMVGKDTDYLKSVYPLRGYLRSLYASLAPD